MYDYVYLMCMINSITGLRILWAWVWFDACCFLFVRMYDIRLDTTGCHGMAIAFIDMICYGVSLIQSLKNHMLVSILLAFISHDVGLHQGRTCMMSWMIVFGSFVGLV